MTDHLDTTLGTTLEKKKKTVKLNGKESGFSLLCLCNGLRQFRSSLNCGSQRQLPSISSKLTTCEGMNELKFGD